MTGEGEKNTGSAWACTGCGIKYKRNNTHCSTCGQDFCLSCSQWWDSGLECYNCRQQKKGEIEGTTS